MIRLITNFILSVPNMPNETLITQLNLLRDIYGQQQKSLTTTQKAFKAFVDAGSKVQKAFKDYNARLDLQAPQAAFAQLRFKEEAIDPIQPDLRREIKLVTMMSGALRDAATALNTEPVDIIKLDKAITILRTANRDDMGAILPELDAELELAQRALGDEFGQKLRDALAQQGLSIGKRTPKFDIGRFELEANFAKRFITLRYGKEIVVPRAAITVEAAVKAYQTAAKAISGRNLDGKTWMAQFYAAYHTARRKRDGEARINIVECYVEFVLLNQGRNFFAEPSKRTFKDYGRAEFIYDFYEFAHTQRIIHNGEAVKAHSATKSQTDNAAKSMWIVEGDTPYDGRYVADIEFVQE